MNFLCFTYSLHTTWLPFYERKIGVIAQPRISIFAGVGHFCCTVRHENLSLKRP